MIYEEALAGVPDESRRILIDALDAMTANLADGDRAETAQAAPAQDRKYG